MIQPAYAGGLMWRRQPRMYGLTLKRRACLNPDHPALNGIEMSFRLAAFARYMAASACLSNPSTF